MRFSRFSRDCAAIVAIGSGLLIGSDNALAQRPLGIDVSSFQGNNINWTNVKSSGVSFAWAKATQGNYYIDADFTINEANAKAAGVLIGAYDFADYNDLPGTNGAVTEATYFWNEASPYIASGGYYLVPMLDVEEALTNNTGATVSLWVNTWCTTISNFAAAKGLNVRPVVYTYTSFASDYLSSSVTVWPLWMASPNGESPQTGAPNSTSPWSTWTFWQYDTSSTVPGVTSGDCDQDVFNGTSATLLNYVIGGVSAPAGATVYWDPAAKKASPGSGGTGNWDLGTSDWWYSGSSNVAYSSGGDNPVFAGTNGTVTLNAGVSAGSLTFNTAGYVITGTANTITLTNPATISVPPPGTSPTYIDCLMAGGAGYTVEGGGVLVMNNTSNTIAGGVTVVSNTTLVIPSAGALAYRTGTANLSGGGILQNNDQTSGDSFVLSSYNIALGTGGGVLNDNINAYLTYSGIISGAGSLTKTGGGGGTGGTLVLEGSNTFTGNTIISQGVLALGSTGSINSTAEIIIDPGASLDVSAISSWTLNVPLMASGTGTTVGSTAATINGASNGAVNLGTEPITLIYSPSGTNGDSANPPLYIPQGTLTLNHANTFTISNTLGQALGSGKYRLIQCASNISGLPFTNVAFEGDGVASGTKGWLIVTNGNLILLVSDTTTTTLASMTPSTYGQMVTFTATVSPAPSSGTVQFYDNGVALGGPVAVTSNTASFSTNNLTVGNHPITATYSGAGFFLSSSTSAATTQQVSATSLSVTANAQSKVYGVVLAFGSGSTNFTSSGLQNSETIGSVTLAVSGNGGASNAPVGTYTITPSAATGGTFNPSDYSITYITNALTVTLPANKIPVTITSVSVSTNGAVQLSFSGTPGYVYYIEAATNLTPPATWTIISTNAADGNGLFNYTDTNATNFSARYYCTTVQQ